MTGTLSAGPGSPLGLGGLFFPVPVKTSAYTANPGEFVPCDTTGGAFTVTLPRQPQDGTAVEVKVVRQGGTNAVTVATAGGDTVNVQGGGTSQSLPLLYQGAIYQYRAAIGVWYVLGDDLALAQLDTRYIPASAVGAAGGVAGLDGSSHSFKANLPNVLRSDYKFAPEDFGGIADVIIVSDATISSGTNTLACTTSTPFTSTAVDGGKYVYIVGAGAGGADYYGNAIVSVTNSGHAVLSANAGTSVTNAGMAFGTDNTAATRAAQAGMWAFTATSSREPALVMLGGGYGTAGTPVVGGSTLGNAMYPMAVWNTTGRKARARLVTGSNASALNHWQQTQPQLNGSAVVLLTGGATVDATYGPPSVFGGPFAGYGGATSVFNNMLVTVDGVSVLAPWDSGFTGFDWLGQAEASMPNWGMHAMATVPAGTGWPQMTGYASLTRTTAGLRMPDTNNNDYCDIGEFGVEGLIYGIMPSEHTTWTSGRAIYCFVACRPYSGSAMAHGIFGGHLSAEACTYAVSPMPSGVSGFVGGNSVKVFIDRVDTESVTAHLYDPGDLAEGEISVGGNYNSGSGSPAGYGNVIVTGGAGVRVYDLLRVRGPATAPPAVTSGSPWANLYYGNAEITLSVSGGTLSALTVNGATKLLPASCTYLDFTVGSGLSFTPTFTGAASIGVNVL